MLRDEPKNIIYTPAWGGLKQQILHLAQFGGSIQVIQGVRGAGKSAFFSALGCEDLGSRFVQIRVERDAPPEIFFASLVAALGLRPNHTSTLGQLIASLRAYVQSQYNERLRIVVAIDDVHFLSDAALAALISVLQGNTDSGIGLHLIFFSEPGIAEIIDSLNLLDVTVHDSYLPTFSPSELKKLVLSHFPMNQKLPSLSAEQIQAIWVDSKGLPGRALELAQGLSNQAGRGKRIFFFKGLPVAHFAALFLLCSALFWVFFLREGEVRSMGSAASVGDRAKVEYDERIIKQLDDVIAVTSNHPVNMPVSLSKSDESFDAVKSKLLKELGEDDGKIEPVSDAIPLSNSRKVAGSFVPSVRQDQEPQAEEQDPSTVEVKPSVKSSIIFAQVHDLKVNTGLTTQEQRLLQYSASGFALQIMALADKEKLDEYIAKQPNKANLLVYKAIRRQKIVYILLEGFYADKQAALMAIANLPLNQRKGGPWPKSLQSIHSEIIANQRK